MCLEVEDENHVLFSCPQYRNIRAKYKEILKTSNTVKKLLNPKTQHDIYMTAKYLKEVEKTHKKFLE